MPVFWQVVQRRPRFVQLRGWLEWSPAAALADANPAPRARHAGVEMSLSASTLADGIFALTGVGNFPATYVIAGQKWADAYATYAAAARSPTAGSPTAIAAAKPALASALAATFAAQASPATTAAQMATAFTAFWMAPPMAFAGSFPGVVTAVSGTAALASALASVWASNISGAVAARAACNNIAAAIHALAATVVITDATVPSPTVGPMT